MTVLDRTDAGRAFHVQDLVRESAEFLGPSSERVFGISHVPEDPIGGLVVCSPLFSEFRINYRRETLLARALAAKGFAVQRFHYRGTGNSEGDPVHTTLETMVEDASATAEHLLTRSGVPQIGFLGSRFGALVATRAISHTDGGPLVLWEPVTEVAPYIREAFMAKVVRDMKDGALGSQTTEELFDRLRTEGVLDVLGHSMHWQLVESALEVSLARTIPDRNHPVLLVQFGGQTLRPSYQEVVTSWSGPNRVQAELVSDEESWWFERGFTGVEVTDRINRHALEITTGWMEREGKSPAKRAESMATITPPIADPPTGSSGSVATEMPVFFPAGDEVLFGVLTEPIVESRGVGVVILQGSSYHNLSAHRNQLAVRLARELAAEGYHSLRFDYHGVGDSTGVARVFLLSEPFVEDLTGAVRCLEARGVQRYVLVGHCFGSRTVLAHALKLPGTVGVVLGALSLADLEPGEEVAARLAHSLSSGEYLRRALRWRTIRNLGDPRLRRTYAQFVRAKLRAVLRRLRIRDERPEVPWLNPHVLDMIDELGSDGLPTLLAYGTTDLAYRGFLEAVNGRLGRMLDRYRRSMDVRVIEGNLHAFPTIASQDSFLGLTVAWIRDQTV